MPQSFVHNLWNKIGHKHERHSIRTSSKAYYNANVKTTIKMWQQESINDPNEVDSSC